MTQLGIGCQFTCLFLSQLHLWQVRGCSQGLQPKYQAGWHIRLCIYSTGRCTIQKRIHRCINSDIQQSTCTLSKFIRSTQLLWRIACWSTKVTWSARDVYKSYRSRFKQSFAIREQSHAYVSICGRCQTSHRFMQKGLGWYVWWLSVACGGSFIWRAPF